jgi:hypothetical protein
MAVCWAITPMVDAFLQSGGVAAIIAAAFGLALTAKYAATRYSLS